MSVTSSQQFAAFHSTTYRVDSTEGAFTLRIDQYSPELLRLHETHRAASSAYLTAWNPLGEVAAAASNGADQAALRRDLAALGVQVLSGEGRDPATGWAEQSLLAIGLSSAQSVGLGNRYRQLALLFAGADAVPRLVLLR